MVPGDVTESKTQEATTNKTLILVIVCVVSFFISFLGVGLNVAIPAIGKEFSANAILLNWVVTVSILTSGVFSIPCGRIADMFGLKKIFILGLIIFLPFTILTVFSNSIYMLMVCQAIQAIGLGMILATSAAILVAVFPPEERGKALGFNVGVLYFGFSTSPLVCGFLTEQVGWRSIYLIAVPGCLIGLILLLWKVKQEWVHSRGEKFDYPGAVIFGLSLIFIMYGFSVLPELYGFFLLLSGIIGMFIFFKWESSNSSPVFDVSILRNNRVFLFSNLTAFISYSAVAAVAYLLSLYLQYNKGLTPGAAGLVLAVQPVIQAALSPLSGWLSDKIEPRIVVSVGMGLTCAGLVPFAFVAASTPLIWIVVPLFILGMGFGIFSSPNTNAIMSSVSEKNLGVASALSGTMRTLGILFSMAVTMILMSIFVGRVVITPEHYDSFLVCLRVAFAIFTALCFTGIFFSLSRGKVR
jgi:MFS family permease